ncbi:ABC transporter ATP-binding protein [Micromonospora haikouensis]|uniref:ABC transporter ATP-binding protein n=1 Tax=Micromonospora haikouensis TaxID=686309 RepID=UPI0005C4F27E|nr:ABC transporter ATP-binding protein [Micromonospora haikouensis]
MEDATPKSGEAAEESPNGGAVGRLRDAFSLAWDSSRGLIVLRLLLTLVGGAIPVAAAWLTKSVLDRLASGTTVSMRDVLPIVLALAGVGVTGIIITQSGGYVQGRMGRAIELVARERFYQAVIRIPGLSKFENPHFHDRLQLAGAASTSGPTQLFEQLLGFGQGALVVGGFIGTLLVLSPWTVLVVLIAAVPTLRAELMLGRHRVRMMTEISRSQRREMFYADLLTSVVAAKEIRLYGLGELFRNRMISELRDVNSEHERMDRRELLVQGLLGLMGALVAGGGLVWAVLAALAGDLSIGDVSVFIAAVAGVQSGLSRLIQSAAGAHEAGLMFDHYRYIVRSEPEASTPVGGGEIPVPTLRGGIEFRDVWFRYGDDLPWVLRGVNLTIPAGAATALVGLNGAGKSTIVKLLCRFYDPSRGAVLWDGIDVRQLSLAELRHKTRAVFQDFMQYDLTVAENIGIGDVTAIGDRKRIVEVAETSGCDDFIARLPGGYDTMLSRMFFDFADKNDTSTGVVLSGGQWQRLAIARALMQRQSELLILDEPSAGLDAEAEYELHCLLRNYRHGHTSVLIAHRLSTIRDADNIVVISEGRVAEQGTHEQLIGLSGMYARLFGMQASGYADDTDVPPGEGKYARA